MTQSMVPGKDMLVKAGQGQPALFPCDLKEPRACHYELVPRLCLPARRALRPSRKGPPALCAVMYGSQTEGRLS